MEASLVFGVTALSIVLFYWLRRASLYSADWLFQGESWTLTAADAVLKGQSLYRDIQWNYGPFPIYYYAAFAALFGNTPVTLIASNALLYSTALGCFYVAAARCMTRFWAIAGLALTTLPLVIGASELAENTAPFELLFLSIVAALYLPPGKRSCKRSLLLGALCGAMQWSKFGSGVVAAISVVLVDLMAQTRSEDGAPKGASWANLLAGVSGFLLLEGARLAYHFSTLPRPYALDTAFPLYHREWYSSYVTPAIRFPRYESLGFLLGVQLPAIAGFACGLGICASAFFGGKGRGSRFPAFPYALCLPPLFYFLGCIGYFRHMYHFYEYSLLLGVPMVYIFARTKLVGRMGVIAVMVPMIGSIGRGVWRDTRSVNSSVQSVALLHGTHLLLNPRDREFVADLARQLARYDVRPGGRPVVSFPSGDGLEYFLGFPRVGRHSHVERVLMRPYERLEYFRQVSSSAGILLLSQVVLEKDVRLNPNKAAVAVFSIFTADQDHALMELMKPPMFIGDRAVFIPFGAPPSAGGATLPAKG